MHTFIGVFLHVLSKNIALMHQVGVKNTWKYISFNKGVICRKPFEEEKRYANVSFRMCIYIAICAEKVYVWEKKK